MRIPPRLFAAAFILAFCFALPVRANDAPKTDIDINRVREIYERQQKGEKLSAEDQAYLDKAKASRQRSEQPAAQPGAPAGSGIDMERVKALYQREQNGEKLSAEDQDYLDKAKASMKRRETPGDQKGAPASGGIDWDKAKALYQREQSGEKLSADDQAYLEKAKAAHERGESPGAQPGGARPATGQPGAGAGIEWERAKAIHQREQNGEKLSADDQAYLDKAKAALQGGARPDGAGNNNGGGERGKPPGATAAPTPGKTSVDITPLTDLAVGEKYKDQDGGLYGNGQNHPTGELLKLAQAASAVIQPLDFDGKASPNGKIVLLTIGMSNTTMESSSFKRLADADARKAADVVIVDGAQGGKDAAAWANSPANEKVWETADARLTAASASPKQVQVLWIKQALMGPARHGEFPKHAEDLKSDIEQILVLAKQHYPNVRIAYLSSRIYAGYAGTALNPEPYAYEGAFSVRWVIQDQLKSSSPINPDPAKGEVKAPLALWGPYLWADGIKGRKTDAVIYERKDLGADGTHPSESGREKVAEMLLSFFTTDEMATGWFVKK